jgi:twitching motility protein PilT
VELSQSPITPQTKIISLLERVLEEKASDLHLTVGNPPVLRVDGQLIKMEDINTLSAKDVEDLCFSLIDKEQQERLKREREIDFAFSLENKARFRVNFFYEKGCLAGAFRYLPQEIRTITELGLPPIIEKFTEHAQGFVLVTGPTGHGKTTTLAALIDKINKERACHIITIEDPIEYVFLPKKAIVAQREVGTDTHSFARALKYVLREDPDVVLVGEMRDLESIAAALTIAETGHLVFATLHTNSAAETIDRIIDVFPPHQQNQVRVQLSNTLLGIVSQRLIPKIGGGRVVAAEVLFANAAVRNLIREGKSYQLNNIIQTGAEENMVSLDKTLAALVRSGKITLEDALMYAIDSKFLRRLIGGGS